MTTSSFGNLKSIQILVAIILLGASHTFAQISTISPTHYCSTNQVTINMSLDAAETNELNYSWNGGSYTSTGYSHFCWGFSNCSGSYTFTFPHPGSYVFQQYSHAAGSSLNSHHYYSDTIYYYPTLTINIAGADTICPGSVLLLSATATPARGSYTWTPGGYSTNTVSFTGAPATVSVQYSYGGCTVSRSRSPFYDSISVALHSRTAICVGDTISVRSISVGGLGTLHHHWSSGSLTDTAMLLLSSVGLHLVADTVSDLAQCRVIGVDSILSHPYPQSVIGPVATSFCQDSILVFTDLSVIDPNPFSDSISFYSWYYGSVAVSLSSSVSYSFPAAGSYTMHHRVQTSFGCAADTGIIVTVYPVPHAGLEVSDLTICRNAPVLLTDLSGIPGVNPFHDSITTFGWYSDTTLISHSANSNYFFPASGTFDLLHYVRTDHGCYADTTVSILVYPDPIVRINSNGRDSICSGLALVLSDTLLAGYRYQWSTGSMDTLYYLYIPNSNAGSTSYRLSATDQYGCTNSSSRTITVLQSPDRPLIAHADSVYCQNSQYNSFSVVQPQSGVFYQWTASQGFDLQNGLTANCYINMPGYSQVGEVFLQATSAVDGCIEYDTAQIAVGQGQSPSASVIFSANTLICTDNTVHYQWGYTEGGNFADSVLSGETQQAYLLPAGLVPGRYYWVIITKDGCSNKIYYNTPLGIYDIVDQTVIEFFPNPLGDRLQIRVANDEVIRSISIYSIDGKEVWSDRVGTPGLQETEIDVSGLIPGAYCARVEISDGQSIRNLIVKH